MKSLYTKRNSEMTFDRSHIELPKLTTERLLLFGLESIWTPIGYKGTEKSNS